VPRNRPAGKAGGGRWRYEAQRESASEGAVSFVTVIRCLTSPKPRRFVLSGPS